MKIRVIPGRGGQNQQVVIGLCMIAIVLAIVGWALPLQSVIEPNTSSQCAVGYFGNNVTETNGTLAIFCSQVGWTELTNFPSPCDNGKFVVSINASIVCAYPDWSFLQNFPNGCVSGSFVTAVGSTLTCQTPGPYEAANTAKCNAGQFLTTLNESSAGVASYSCDYPSWSRLTGFPSDCSAGQFVTGVGVTLTCSTVGWTQLTSFPSGCGAGQVVSAVGNTLTCVTYCQPNGTNCGLDFTTNIFSYWKLDDNSGSSATDSSGNAHTATLTSSPIWTTCKFTDCLDFSGTNYFSSTAQLPTNFTLSTWIFYNNNLLPTSTQFIAFQAGVHSDAFYAFVTATDTITFHLGFKNGFEQNCVGTSILTDNQWSWITLIYDNASTTGKIFVNGQVDTSCSFAGHGAIDTRSGNFIVGSFNGSSGITGRLDDVRIYSASLIQTDINQLKYWYTTIATA